MPFLALISLAFAQASPDPAIECRQLGDLLAQVRSGHPEAVDAFWKSAKGAVPLKN